MEVIAVERQQVIDAMQICEHDKAGVMRFLALNIVASNEIEPLLRKLRRVVQAGEKLEQPSNAVSSLLAWPTESVDLRASCCHDPKFIHDLRRDDQSVSCRSKFLDDFQTRAVFRSLAVSEPEQNVGVEEIRRHALQRQ